MPKIIEKKKSVKKQPLPLPPSPCPPPEPPKLTVKKLSTVKVLQAYGFAADPEIMDRVAAHCGLLAADGITLRMILGCVNHLINESDRKP